MCKEDTNFEICLLILVGNRGWFPSIWLENSFMLEFPMQGPVLDRIWVHTNWVWYKYFSLVYVQRGYQIESLYLIVFKITYTLCSRVLVLVVMLSRVHSYILYLSRNFIAMFTTWPELGWSRLSLVKHLLFIVLWSTYKVCNRVLVMVGMLSWVWPLGTSYIQSYSLINSNVMIRTRPNLGWYRFGLVTNLYLIVL